MKRAEEFVLLTQTYLLFKFILALFIYYFLIPKLVFPKEIYEKFENWHDKFVFNVTVMTGLSTLVFPFFVIARVFGTIFLFAFFFLLKLAFVKFYYKRPVLNYLLHSYHYAIYLTIRFLEKGPVYFALMKKNLRKKYVPGLKRRLKVRFLLRFILALSVVAFSAFPFVYRGLICWVEASPDVSQFYYWFNLLRKNVIIDRTAGAPYMWGGPMILHTINTVINVDPLAIVNLAPLLYVGVFFTGLYVLVSHLCRSIDRKSGVSNAPLVAILVFTFVMAYKLGVYLVGGSISTTDPWIADLKILKVYFKPFLPRFLEDFQSQHFFSFWRMTAYAEEEHAFCFYVISLYLYIKTLETRKNLYLFLFSVTLGILVCIHAAYGMIVAFTYLPILLYSLFTDGLEISFLLKGLKQAVLGTVAGLLWMGQFFVFGFPSVFGKALPFLDVLFNKNKPKAALVLKPIDLYAVTVFCPTEYVFALLGTSAAFIIAGLLFKARLKPLGYVASFTIGVLLIHSFSNFGFPPLSNKTRVNNLLAMSYALELSVIYFLIFEALPSHVARLKNLVYYLSSVAVAAIVGGMFLISPAYAYLFSPKYKRVMVDIEHEEFPVAVYRIRKEFQPFTYTIVSNVQQFAQVIGKGFHINTYRFLLDYRPTDRYLPIPTDYVFIFVENVPKKFMGLGEFWYRWRIDHTYALKSWIVQYAATHRNIKLWFSNDQVEIYIIDNRNYTKLLRKKKIKELGLEKVIKFD